jgi:crotonobetainyl-CoA:carnitine CoA-transferase CaiB-like acyl-CoA transferase
VKPLDGLKVLDFTINVSGPFATMILGDLGADVIKVERVDGGDDCRAWGPFWGDKGCYFLDVNRNKRSICLDLKHSTGLDLAQRLAVSADVVVENFRPGTMDRLGLGFDALHERNPRLTYCSISGFGTEGPRRKQGGFDPTLQALSGMMWSSGCEGDPPSRVGPSVIDKGSSLWAAIGILSALHRRNSTGVGEHVEVSLLGTAMSWLSYDMLGFLATGILPGRLGTGAPGSVPSQAFETSDGFVHVAVGNDRIWASFCAAIERPDLVTDVRYARNEGRLASRAELTGILEPVFAAQTREYWLGTLERHGVPCASVNTVEESLQDPQVQALGLVEQDGDEFAMIASPINLAAGAASRPPGLGEHTETILTTELGLAPEEITTLRAQRVVA